MKRTLLFCLLFISFQFHAFADEPDQIAIIIDDFGGSVKGVDAFLSGNIPITVAVMPFQKHSAEQARRAHEAGLEVMIHMPMEPKQGKASWLGPKAIKTELPDHVIRQYIEEAIANVPYAIGLNNHMGSKIVENEHIMRIVLEVAKENGLYVVDSGTSPHSVIPKIAEELGIPFATRNVFLDNTRSSRQYVSQQMDSLLNVAKKNKKAIAIGHVGLKGHETYAGIVNVLSKLNENNVEIVPVSHLLETNVEKEPEYFWQHYSQTERMTVNK